MAGEDFFVIGRRPLTEAEATCRYIFLDFDGARTRPGVAHTIPVPSEAKLNAESIERILATLNDVFAPSRSDLSTRNRKPVITPFMLTPPTRIKW